METLRIAVTGGAGFVGSHAAKRLIQKGHEVLIIDNLSSGSIQNLKDLGIEQDCMIGDLRDYNFAKEALKGADIVYHFAAEVGSVEYLHGSIAKELAALQANVTIDANVLRSCVENGINRILYASSVSVYPYSRQLADDAVFKEEDFSFHADPEGGYGWAKYIAERQLFGMKDMHAGIARIFHAYGENIYLAPDRSQVIASLIRKAVMYPKEDFVVWGDGKQKRCFVFIDDTIEAIELIRQYADKNGTCAFNVGSEEEVTIGRLAEMIVGISQKGIRVSYDTSKPKGARSRKPDLSLVSRVLGWKPKTSLKDGLKRTFLWAERRLQYGAVKAN
ncbi:MAG: NAD-dependent epimerase/dehydratase family protein [Conexivisphaerales archaeon]